MFRQVLTITGLRFHKVYYIIVYQRVVETCFSFMRQK